MPIGTLHEVFQMRKLNGWIVCEVRGSLVLPMGRIFNEGGQWMSTGFVHVYARRKDAQHVIDRVRHWAGNREVRKVSIQVGA